MTTCRRITKGAHLEEARRLFARYEPDEPHLASPIGKHPTWAVFSEEGQAGDMLGVGSAWVDTSEKVLHLTTCLVVPAARGLGVQRSLIKARCAYGKRCNLKEARTYTARNNRPSQINLLKEGFVPYSVTGGFWISYAKYLR